MKDKLKKILQMAVVGLMWLLTVSGSLILVDLGLKLINQPNNLSLLLGTVTMMTALVLSVVGIVAIIYFIRFIKTRKD